MIPRRITTHVQHALKRQAAVALIGPRQVGKTTLALALAAKQPSIEIKRSLAPVPSKGFYHAREDLKPSQTFIVYAGHDTYPIAKGIDVIGVRALAEKLAALE